MPDLGPVAEEIGEHMVNSVQRNFQAGGRPETWKTKWNDAPSFLYETGALMNSIYYLTEDRGGDWMIYVSSFGVPYAGLHQFGGSTPTGGYIHPRPYLVIQDEDVPWIEERVMEEILTHFIKSNK